MASVPLSEVAKIMMGQSPPSSTYNDRGDGLPFFQGKADFGAMHPTVRVFCNRPARIAEVGDILISVRAPVGPTNIADRRSCIGRGLAALRPSPDLDVRFLLYFLRYREPVIAKLGLGSTFDAISREDLDELLVPLPSIADQRRIAATLDHAGRLLRMRRYAVQLSDSFPPAAFLDTFGDPLVNPRGWKKRALGDVVRIRRGASPRPIERFLGGTVPWIKIGDGTKGELFYISSTEDAVTEEGAAKSVRLAGGALVFANCGVSLGFARILRISGCIHDGWLALDEFEDHFHPLFLLSVINQLTNHFRRLAPEGTQPNLNTEIMSKFEMIVPDRQEQDRFVSLLERFQRLREGFVEAERQGDHLFQSLLRRAFADRLGT